MIKLTLNGNTYGIKETLKNLGFKWDNNSKSWTKTFTDDNEEYANELATRWFSEGVYGKITKN